MCFEERMNLAHGQWDSLLGFFPREDAHLGLWREHRALHRDRVRLGEEAGYMPVNARTIWDAGAILGYCTDTTYDPKAGLELN